MKTAKLPELKNGMAYASAALFLGAAILLIYAVLQIGLIPVRLVSDGKAVLKQTTLRMRTLKPESLDDYEKDLAGHALFYIPKKHMVSKGPGLGELAQQYQVIGLVGGAQPEAIIQDRSNQQSFFVQAGEKFNQIELIQIKSHSVVLQYNQQTLELQLEE